MAINLKERQEHLSYQTLDAKQTAGPSMRSQMATPAQSNGIFSAMPWSLEHGTRPEMGELFPDQLVVTIAPPKSAFPAPSFGATGILDTSC
jgi:hypothetical protein